MSLSDCIKCWDTPCICGYGYTHLSTSVLQKLIAELQTIVDSRTPEIRQIPEERQNKMQCSWCRKSIQSFTAYDWSWMEFKIKRLISEPSGNSGASLTEYAGVYCSFDCAIHDLKMEQRERKLGLNS